MKKFLFKISIFIYLSLFTFVSYILTTTCLENKTNTSIIFLVGYYILFGFSIISFIRSGIKELKKNPNFEKVKLTKEKVLKKGAFIIYLLLFAFSSYILIKMRMNNASYLLEAFIAYMIIFVIPCWNMFDNHIIKLNSKIKFSCFKNNNEYLEYLTILANNTNKKETEDEVFCYHWYDEENYYDRQTREYDEYYAHSLAQKQLDDLGNCHRW